ncbi:MAG TPA: phospholipase D-like domain-containing protein [Paucimonas sp.]|nr:phospholipase D-like domain-containing protein [Paucimonas sp.]
MRPVILTAHNDIRLLHCGAEFFPALLDAIDNAQAEIYLETYIFATDPTADRVREALKRAASRGVVVNVITDWLGTGNAFSKWLKQDFAAAGVHHRSFNPRFNHGVARTHRKICVVDRKLAFLGGININDDMLSDDNSKLPLPAPRWDFAVRITGPLVYDIHLEVEVQWLKLGRLNILTRLELFREVRNPVVYVDEGPMLAGLVVRDNLRNRRTIQRNYLKALGVARKSALLANPYFAPGRKLRDALAQAADRGVEVVLLLGVGQFRIQDAVAHSFYPKLLKAGVKIVEYRKTQLHGKVAVVDDDWATVGSSNYDGLSLFVNQEANIIVRDAAFSNALRAHIERAAAEGVVIDPLEFANIPWYKRLWYDGAYLFYRSVLWLLTIGKYSD